MSIRDKCIAWLNNIIEDSLYGSIPDCKECNKKAMHCFCDKLHNIEMGRGNEA